MCFSCLSVDIDLHGKSQRMFHDRFDFIDGDVQTFQGISCNIVSHSDDWAWSKLQIWLSFRFG